jgi:hypothetical protein
MSDDLDRKIEIAVTAEVEKQLSRERAVLKDVGGIALKIIAGSFVLLFAIFTVFGLTTWNDVKKETSAFVKDRADELIQRSDSETSVKQTLNNLVNRAIVASELLRLKRDSGQELELPQSEWDRLRNWLKVENLDIHEFTDVLTILNAQKKDRKKADANGFLSEMLSPPDSSSYQWMKKQPDKRVAIMTTFEQMDMGASAVEVATSSGVSEDTKIAAIRYIRTLRFAEGFDKIFRVGISADEGVLKREALVTSAALRPTDLRVLGEIEKLTNQSAPRSSSLRIVTEIVREIWRNQYEQEGEPDRLEMGKRLLEFAFKHGIYLREDQSALRVRLADGDLPAPRASVLLWIPTGRGTASGYSLGDGKQFNQLTPYWTLLNDAADSNDIPKIKRLAIRASSPRPAMKITIPKEAALIVENENGEQITLLRDIAESVRLAVIQSKSENDNPLQVSWGDTEKRTFRGKLAGFSGKGFKFSYTPITPE